MATQEVVDKLEEQMRERKKAIEVGAALQRLEANPDYQLVIGGIYGGEVLNNLLRIRTQPGLPADQKDSITELILGVGAFMNFTDKIMEDAQEAKARLPEDEKTHAELFEEGIE